MQALVMTSTFPRWANDVEPAFVFELSRRLAREYDVTVLSPRTPGSQKQENMGGLKVIRFPYFLNRFENLAMSGGGILNKLKSNPLYYLLIPFFLLGQLWAVVRLLRNERFDLIHAHWLIPQGLIAVLGIMLSGKNIPLICTSHGGDLFALQGSILQTLKRWIVNKSKALTVVSQAMKKAVEDMGIEADKVQVISMGVDLKSLFTPDFNNNRGNAELLFVGRLVDVKGVQKLLESMPLALKKNPEIHLSIAGAGPLEEELRANAFKLNIAEKISFLGMVQQSMLPELYRRAAIAIFPFLITESGVQEGFGLVVVEAMGCACPIIAGDVPAVRETVLHEETGLLVESKNAQALADAIIRMLDNPDLRFRLARNGCERVGARFDWEIIAQKYAGVYRDCIKA